MASRKRRFRAAMPVSANALPVGVISASPRSDLAKPNKAAASTMGSRSSTSRRRSPATWHSGWFTHFCVVGHLVIGSAVHRCHVSQDDLPPSCPVLHNVSRARRSPPDDVERRRPSRLWQAEGYLSHVARRKPVNVAVFFLCHVILPALGVSGAHGALILSPGLLAQPQHLRRVARLHYGSAIARLAAPVGATLVMQDDSAGNCPGLG